MHQNLEGNYQNEFNEIYITKNINHSNKTCFQENLEVPQAASPERHSHETDMESKTGIPSESTTIELEGHKRATEILSN